MRDDCIEWKGPRKNGYGVVSKHRWNHPDRVREYAHRLAYAKANGPIPEGMHVLHRCDNPPCVNVVHLFLGTQADNMRDMSAKGRASNQYVNRTHCKRGHPLVPRGNKKWRYCRICHYAHSRRYREEIRAGTRPPPPSWIPGQKEH